MNAPHSHSYAPRGGGEERGERNCFSLEDAKPVGNLDVFPTQAESLSVLHFTSGTTGVPKGVKRVHSSLLS